MVKTSVFIRRKLNPKEPEHFRVFAQYNDQQLGFQSREASPVQQAFFTAMEAQAKPPSHRYEWFKPAAVRATTYAGAWDGAVNIAIRKDSRAKQIAFHTDPKDRWRIITKFIQPHLRSQAGRAFWTRQTHNAKVDYVRKLFTKYLELRVRDLQGDALMAPLTAYDKKITLQLRKKKSSLLKKEAEDKRKESEESEE